MPPSSNTSEAGGRKSAPRPTERTNPSSTRISGTRCRPAISARPGGMRDAQTAMAPGSVAQAPLPERHAAPDRDPAIGELDPAPLSKQSQRILERGGPVAEWVAVAGRD